MSDVKTEALGWVVLELMGHRRLGGYLTPIEIAGKGFLRIDVPTPETNDASGPWSASQIYSPDSVYCITPTTIEIAKIAAVSSVVAPVSRWELPAAKEPEAPRKYPAVTGDDDDQDDELDIDEADLPRSDSPSRHRSDFMPKTLDPAFQVACPKCGVTAGTKCQNYLGKGKFTCKERVQAWSSDPLNIGPGVAVQLAPVVCKPVGLLPLKDVDGFPLDMLPALAEHGITTLADVAKRVEKQPKALERSHRVYAAFRTIPPFGLDEANRAANAVLAHLSLGTVSPRVPVPSAPPVVPPDDFDESTPPPRQRQQGDPVPRFVKFPPGESVHAEFQAWDRKGRIPPRCVLAEFLGCSERFPSGYRVECYPDDPTAGLPLGPLESPIAADRVRSCQILVTIQRGARTFVVLQQQGGDS